MDATRYREVLEALARRTASGDVRGFLTRSGHRGVLIDLHAAGQRLDLASDEGRIACARAAFGWNKRLLRRHHGLDVDRLVADGVTTEETAFAATMLYGHRGAIPYLLGRRRLPGSVSEAPVHDAVTPQASPRTHAPADAAARDIVWLGLTTPLDEPPGQSWPPSARRTMSPTLMPTAPHAGAHATSVVGVVAQARVDVPHAVATATVGIGAHRPPFAARMPSYWYDLSETLKNAKPIPARDLRLALTAFAAPTHGPSWSVRYALRAVEYPTRGIAGSLMTAKHSIEARIGATSLGGVAMTAFAEGHTKPSVVGWELGARAGREVAPGFVLDTGVRWMGERSGPGPTATLAALESGVHALTAHGATVSLLTTTPLDGAQLPRIDLTVKLPLPTHRAHARLAATMWAQVAPQAGAALRAYRSR